ncbi:capsule biosynthesis GfcC family protein [Stenotrophomonas pennii]|uniref:capsule biosynthesis GfcC family protein n=1 Tax=Stenotrophomonas lacuserhaii TaxID=2760084 RepID=UPI003207EA6D
MMFRSAATLVLLACSFSLWAAAPVPGVSEVSVQGAVEVPGAVQVQAGGRISDVLNAVRPSAAAYLLGSSLQREHERQDQLRLRAGLLHTLGQLPQHENLDVRAAGERLHDWLEAHPATGRVRLVLDRRLMQAQPPNNPIARQGDSIIIPLRPHTVHVVGAVTQPCTLPHQPLQDAKAYLAHCPVSVAADPDTLYVVQPDGLVQALGIAAWNRADPQPVAAGGTIYVPVRESAMKHIDTSFNEDFASFIATQPVDP